MSEKEKCFETWKEVMIYFLEHKVSKTKLYKASEYIKKKDTEITKESNPSKLDKLNKAREEKYKELITLRREAPSNEIPQLLDDICKKKLADGKKLIQATHVLRFSHSSASAQGIVLSAKHERPLLTTGSFKRQLVFDIAHNNGNLITVSRFFSLTCNDEKLIELVLKDNFSFLEQFSKNEKRIDLWKEGLSLLVEERTIKTGEKSRQMYFPVNINPELDKDYHLLIPLFSSSFCEEIYTWVNKLKFGEIQKNIKEAMKPKGSEEKPSKYHSDYAVSTPAIGVIKFGGAQPQNISMLNKSRSWKANKKDKVTYGITYLFSCQPSIWQAQFKPPVNKSSLFSDLYSSAIKTEVDYLRDFLLRFKQLDLSIKDPKRKRHLIRWVENIIDEFLFYISSIQNLSSGWTETKEIRLKEAHQLLLDPYRLDDDFQNKRQNIDWQLIIRADFAQWLNRQLRGKNKQFTPQAEHTRLWKKLLEKPLREHMECIEQETKQKMRGAV